MVVDDSIHRPFYLARTVPHFTTLGGAGLGGVGNTPPFNSSEVSDFVQPQRRINLKAATAESLPLTPRVAPSASLPSDGVVILP